ncbi:MAG: hypothetical protein JRE47_11040 [Deltaproteobacteria bacterium]|nr:hypothetical protein [Deltaproteobacteria bacterium]
MEYPLEDRRQFALFAHATQCFRYCVEACDYVKEHNLKMSDFLYKPLSEWAITEYGKPFKKSRGLGKIPEKMIPQRHIELHEFILRVRDKMVAHVDTIGLENPEHGFHKVRLERTMRNFNYIVEAPRVRPQKIEQLRILAKKLEEKSHYHATKHVKKLSKIVKGKGLGEFLIDIEKSEGGITKLKDKEKAILFGD